MQPKAREFGKYLGLNIVTFTLITYKVSLEILKITSNYLGEFELKLNIFSLSSTYYQRYHKQPLCLQDEPLLLPYPLVQSCKKK